MSDMTPTLQQILEDMRGSVLGQLLITMPAIVERFDRARECVDATPCIPLRVEQEDGSVQLVQLPTSVSCPVLFGAATWPIVKGSVVVLMYVSANISSWLALGGRSVEAPDERCHDPCSAFAIPAGHSFDGATKQNRTASDDAYVIHAAKVRSGGPDANDPVVRKSDLDATVARLNATISALLAHTHLAPGGTTNVPTGSGSSAGSVATLTTMTAPACSSTTYTK